MSEWVKRMNGMNGMAQAKKDHLKKVVRSFRAPPVLAKTVKYITSSFTTVTKALLKNTLRKKVKFCICGVDGHCLDVVAARLTVFETKSQVSMAQ